MNHATKRPGLIIFVAIIMILIGSWSVLGSICGGASIALIDALPKMPAGQGQQDPTALARFLTKEVPGYYPVVFGLLAIDFFLGIFKIGAGIGLLRMSSTARMIAILLVIVSLLLALAGAVYNVVFLLPTQARFIEAHPGPENAMTQALSIGGLVFGLVLQIGIAATVLILLNTKANKDAFQAASQPPAEDEHPRSRYEGYEDEDDRPPETGITDRPM